MIDSNEAARKRWNESAVSQERSKQSVGSREWYEELWHYRYEYECPWLPRLLMQDVHGKEVLEVGVGIGLDAGELIRRGAKYSGIDVTENHLEKTAIYLQQNGWQANAMIQGDIASHPFEQNFDIVYSFGVLHHLEHEETALQNIHSMLKVGGELRVGLYSKYSFFNAYMLATWILRNRCKLPFNEWQAIVSDAEQSLTIKVRSQAEITQLYEARGFKLCSATKAGFVQNNRPFIGKHLQPDGIMLRALGRLLGWYHIMIFKKVCR